MQDTHIYILHRRRERQERNENVTRTSMIVREGDMNMMKVEGVRCVTMDGVAMETIPNRVNS